MQSPRSEHGPKLDKTALRKLGEGLVKQYAYILTEPLPQPLASLLARIERDA